MNSLGWDGLVRADMDADLRDVDAQYNGRLKRRICNHCDRDLLSHEQFYKVRYHGKVCEDCHDYIRGDY